MSLNLAGVIPPVVTPFKDEELDLDSLRANLRRLNGLGLSGYLVLGSNGENVFLDQDESDRIIAAAREEVPPGKLLLAGTGAQSTRQTIAGTRRAAGLGAQAALVFTPSYFKGQMNQDRLTAHYQRVAEESPIPILVYNVPANTGLNMGPELIARMAEHDNVIGVKDSSGNIGQLSEILRMVPEDFAVLVGNAPVFYPALTLGARGGILAVANAAPEICLEIHDRVLAGDRKRALELQFLMTPLALMVTVRYGVGGLKAAMDLAGYSGGGVRSPLTLSRSPKVIAELKEELKKIDSALGRAG